MRGYTPTLAPAPQVIRETVGGYEYSHVETAFIYRGVFDSSGTPRTLKDARQCLKWGDKVFAIDLNMCPCLGRCYVFGVYHEGDAIEALYEAARDMGPPAENRINLFTELYGECDDLACWCGGIEKGERGNIQSSDGRLWHENEEQPLGIVEVKDPAHIHDGGWHKWQCVRSADRKKRWHRERTRWLELGLPLAKMTHWRKNRLY